MSYDIRNAKDGEYEMVDRTIRKLVASHSEKPLTTFWVVAANLATAASLKNEIVNSLPVTGHTRRGFLGRFKLAVGRLTEDGHMAYHP